MEGRRLRDKDAELKAGLNPKLKIKQPKVIRTVIRTKVTPLALITGTPPNVKKQGLGEDERGRWMDVRMSCGCLAKRLGAGQTAEHELQRWDEPDSFSFSFSHANRKHGMQKALVRHTIRCTYAHRETHTRASAKGERRERVHS